MTDIAEDFCEEHAILESEAKAAVKVLIKKNKAPGDTDRIILIHRD